MGLSSIADSLFGSSAAAPSVRKPVFEVQFGNPAAADWAQALIGFSVDLGSAPFVDSAQLYTASAEGPTAALADAGTIKAGYDDSSNEMIFTGQIETVRNGIDGVTRFSAGAGAALFARLRVSQSYEQSTAGDIVRDLAQKASITTDSVEDGATYPFYAIDDRRNAWQQIAALARHNGFLAFFSAEGKLNFKPVAGGQPVLSLTYGSDILALQLVNSTPAAGQVTVVGEGAAGSNGSDAWNWLVKDPASIQSQSGQGDPTRLLSEPALRSSNTSQTAADTIVGSIGAATLSGWVLTPGAPAAMPGSTIEIAGAPQDSLNGTCLVQRVQHRFSKYRGFTSRIYFTQTASGSSGGSGGLLDTAKGLL